MQLDQRLGGDLGPSDEHRAQLIALDLVRLESPLRQEGQDRQEDRDDGQPTREAREASSGAQRQAGAYSTTKVVVASSLSVADSAAR